MFLVTVAFRPEADALIRKNRFDSNSGIQTIVFEFLIGFHGYCYPDTLEAPQ